MTSRQPVAIVGGGFSGTMVAAQLARRGIGSLLIDGSGRLGQGTAYSTRQPVHLLNVRAESMSAWPDAPGDFAKRYVAEGGDPRGFAPRMLFGRYLGAILNEAVASGCVTTSSGTATAAQASDDGWTVQLDTGEAVAASALVVATGNEPPADAPSGAPRRFIDNPWGEQAQAAIADLASDGGDALIVGTGLTMVDIVLSLEAAGYQGRILALSRRGLAPRSHAEFQASPVGADEVPMGSPKRLLRWLRRRSAEVGWRAAIDALRPHSAALWQSFSPGEQQRFLRHARPWWDVHRHRIAPEVGATVARMVASGQLEIAAGRILSIDETSEGLTVRYRRRGREREEVGQLARGFNCTGPLRTIARTHDPLLRSLLDAGAARPDQLGMGLAVDQRARVDGSDRLWAVGPLTKGRSWEIVAVPDIRGQAEAIAADIAEELTE